MRSRGGQVSGVSPCNDDLPSVACFYPCGWEDVSREKDAGRSREVRSGQVRSMKVREELVQCPSLVVGILFLFSLFSKRVFFYIYFFLVNFLASSFLVCLSVWEGIMHARGGGGVRWGC